MFCSKCGAVLKENQKFCHICGEAVHAADKGMTSSLETPKNDVPKYEVGANTIPNQPHQPKKLSKKQWGIVGIISVVLAALLIVGIVLSATSDTRKLKKDLKEKNAYSVLIDYDQLVYDGKENKATEIIVEYIYDATNHLNEDFEIHISTAQNSSDIYKLVDDYLREEWGELFLGENDSLYDITNYEVTAALDDFQKMVFSKTSYYLAEFYIQHAETKDEYKKAIENYTKVLSEDTLYEDVKEKIKSASTSYMDALTKSVNSYIAKGDFSAALDLLKSEEEEWNGQSMSQDLIDLLVETKQTYAQQYAQRAEESLKAEDIESAIGCMEAALLLTPENAEYKVKLEEYKLYLPLTLYKEEQVLRIVKEDDFWGIPSFDRTVKANNNTEYAHCIRWYNNNNNAKAKMQFEYVLDGKYNQLSGTLLLPQDERDTTQVGYLEICGDGKVLYTSPKITAGVLPTEFSCDVTNVQKLTINFYGQGTGGFLSEGSAFAVSNLIVKKTLEKK